MSCRVMKICHPFSWWVSLVIKLGGWIIYLYIDGSDRYSPLAQYDTCRHCLSEIGADPLDCLILSEIAKKWIGCSQKLHQPHFSLLRMGLECKARLSLSSACGLSFLVQWSSIERCLKVCYWKAAAHTLDQRAEDTEESTHHNHQRQVAMAMN